MRKQYKNGRGSGEKLKTKHNLVGLHSKLLMSRCASPTLYNVRWHGTRLRARGVVRAAAACRGCGYVGCRGYGARQHAAFRGARGGRCERFIAAVVDTPARRAAAGAEVPRAARLGGHRLHQQRLQRHAQPREQRLQAVQLADGGVIAASERGEEAATQRQPHLRTGATPPCAPAATRGPESESARSRPRHGNLCQHNHQPEAQVQPYPFATFFVSFSCEAGQKTAAFPLSLLLALIRSLAHGGARLRAETVGAPLSALIFAHLA